MNGGGPDSSYRDLETVRLTPGFVIFLVLLLMPALAAAVIYIGAWIVAEDVHAAEQGATTRDAEAGFPVAHANGEEVAGWKKALVGICPAH